LVKKAIAECEKIYDEAEKIIRPGKKDRDVFQYIHQLVDQKNLEYAWASDHCPSVVVGNSPAGHVAYYGDTIHKGDFVRLDFGVKYQGYCSDIQRNYIVGPTTIPAGVKKMFQTATSVTSRYGTCKLEQDVLITSNGYRDLSKPQTELIMVG